MSEFWVIYVYFLVGMSIYVIDVVRVFIQRPDWLTYGHLVWWGVLWIFIWPGMLLLVMGMLLEDGFFNKRVFKEEER